MSNKKKNNSNQRYTPDWRDQLRNLKQEMEDNMTDEERRQRDEEERAEKRRIAELNKRKKAVYEFLAGYKHNSGIYINNFFRKRDYATYCADKFHGFDFDVSGFFPPNYFDDFNFSMSMVRYLGELEKREIAYFPINIEFIKHLIAFSEAMDLSRPIEQDTILYRGCSTLERNGVNGIVSTTTDRDIAEQFSRGTILELHVPRGTKCINTKKIRPREQQRKDKENEILLPPCSYEILSHRIGSKGREPNNHTGKTNFMTLKLSQQDLLEEFLAVAENPPEEFLPIRELISDEYYEAIDYLKRYLAQRRHQNPSM